MDRLFLSTNGSSEEVNQLLRRVPANFEIAQGKSWLIILDNLLSDACSKEVYDMFMKGSHYKNVSAIPITLHLFHQGLYCRDISPNRKYLVLFKTPSIRNSSCFSLVKFIMKIVIFCTSIPGCDPTTNSHFIYVTGCG
jgi:hypothetical protein